MTYDRSINICTGRSRQDTHWKNRSTTWSELVQRLSKENHTSETRAEFLAMDKDHQDRIKDIGGFMGGTLSGPNRTKENVISRSLITLDADDAAPDLIDDLELNEGHAWAVYSTHKDSPGHRRLRILIPLLREVTAEEYEPAARVYAARLGIDQFDDVSFSISQLMYWPSTPADQEYTFSYNDGPWLDPDELLASYNDWHDPKSWPHKAGTPEPRAPGSGQQDPREKENIIGTFCRRYDIPSAIETFLPDAYTPTSSANRYTWTSGTAAGGLVLYDDDVFAYAHDATDPCSGLLVNSFDLVRRHLFGHLDQGADPGTPTENLPSYKAMSDLAAADPGVKEQAVIDAQNDFDGDPLPEDDDLDGDAVVGPHFREFYPLQRSAAVDLPPMPVECLPQLLRDYTAAIAEQLQVDQAMVVMASLGALSTACQGKYVVKIKNGWTEDSVALYLVCIAEPSERKSPVLDLVIVRILTDIEKEINHTRREEIIKWTADATMLQKRIAGIEHRAQSPKTSEDDFADLQEQARTLHADLAKLQEKEPHLCQMTADDITTEALALLMQQNGERGAVVSAEGGILQNMGGRYQNGIANIDLYTKAYAAELVRVNRLSRDTLQLNRPALTMCLMIQPAVLQELTENPAFSGRGLTARFLYAVPRSMVGSRRFETAAASPELCAAWRDAIGNLATYEPFAEQEEITLSEEALAVVHRYHDEIEHDLCGDLAPIGQWAGKLLGNTCRVAALLHALDHAAQPDYISDTPISGSVMQAAVALGKYFTAHAKAVLSAGLADPPEIASAKSLWRHIRGHDQISRRDLHRSAKSRFPDVVDMEPSLQLLRKHGYIDISTESTGGRPRTMIYVNPEAEQEDRQ